MPIEGFDYKAFATDLAQQAMEVLMQPNSNAAPDTLTNEDKKTIVDTVRRFCFMAGEALSNDPQLKFNADQAALVTQFIGEWTFHKSIDLINGGIPVANRDGILQVVAANIFNTAKLAIIKNMPQETLINLVEEKVKQVYDEELQKLVKSGILNQQQFESAVNKSNLNDMVQKTEEESKLVNAQQSVEQSQTGSDNKVLKFAALAILLKRLPQEKCKDILESLSDNDRGHVLNYMKMSNLEDKIDHRIIIKTLEEIKRLLPVSDTINIPKLLKNHYKLLELTSPDKLSRLAQNERESVKDLILDTTFPAADFFSPRVLQCLINTIENKINDN